MKQIGAGFAMRRWTKQLKTILVLAPCVFSGCVSTLTAQNQSAQNWNPQDYDLTGAYYQCLLQAQQASSSTLVSEVQYGVYGSSAAPPKTDTTLLCSCMASKGYKLRSPTTSEVIVDTILAPEWVPYALFGIGENYYCPE